MTPDDAVHSQSTSAGERPFPDGKNGRTVARGVRELALAIVILLGAILVALQTSAEPRPIAPLTMAPFESSSCQQQAVAMLDMDGAAVALPASVTLNSNGFRRILACDPSTLTLQAHGSVADGVGARLVVGWRDATLYDEAIAGDRPVSVQVPDAGWVIVGFVNDLYKPPADRNLRIDGLDLRPVAIQ